MWKNCLPVYSGIPTIHRLKIEESWKIKKGLEFLREKKIGKIRVTLTPIVVSGLGTDHKGQEKILEELDNIRRI